MSAVELVEVPANRETRRASEASGDLTQINVKLVPKNDHTKSRISTFKINELRLATQNGLLDLAPPEYQRLFQAAPEWQQQLVASIFHDLYQIPEMAMRTGKGINGYLGEMMDGLQRLGSIFAFMNGDIVLPKNDFLEFFQVDPEEEPVDLRGCSWLELTRNHPDVADYMRNYKLRFQVYENITSVKAGEIFVDILNNSNDLNAQQKRQAIFSYVSRMVQRIVRGVLADNKPHKMFALENEDKHTLKYINANNTTLKVDQTLAELIYMMNVSIADLQSTGTTNNTITKFYREAGQKFMDSWPKEARLKKTLSTVYEGVIQSGHARRIMDLKEWRNYAFLVSEQLRLKRNVQPIAFLNLYLDAVQALKDKSLINSDTHETKTPYQHFMGGNDGLNTRTTLNLVIDKMSELSDGSEVDELDQKRMFSRDDAKTLYQQQKGVCALCNKDMGEFGSHVEVDHIVDWILGGKTELENGQATHRSCNRRKK